MVLVSGCFLVTVRPTKLISRTEPWMTTLVSVTTLTTSAVANRVLRVVRLGTMLTMASGTGVTTTSGIMQSWNRVMTSRQTSIRLLVQVRFTLWKALKATRYLLLYPMSKVRGLLGVEKKCRMIGILKLVLVIRLIRLNTLHSGELSVLVLLVTMQIIGSRLPRTSIGLYGVLDIAISLISGMRWLLVVCMCSVSSLLTCVRLFVGRCRWTGIVHPVVLLCS